MFQKILLRLKWWLILMLVPQFKTQMRPYTRFKGIGFEFYAEDDIVWTKTSLDRPNGTKVMTFQVIRRPEVFSFADGRTE